MVCATCFAAVVRFISGTDSGNWTPTPTRAVGYVADSAVGDFNGDGFDDLAVIRSVLGGIDVFYSTASGGPGVVQLAESSRLRVSVTELHASDLDGDGFDELVAFYTPGPNAIFELPMDSRLPAVFPGSALGLGPVDPLTATLPPGNPDRGRLADIDNDGDMDLILYGSEFLFVATFGFPTTVLENTGGPGAGAFLERQSSLFSGTVGDLAAADFDGDGVVDLLASREGLGAWNSSLETALSDSRQPRSRLACLLDPSARFAWGTSMATAAPISSCRRTEQGFEFSQPSMTSTAMHGAMSTPPTDWPSMCSPSMGAPAGRHVILSWGWGNLSQFSSPQRRRFPILTSSLWGSIGPRRATRLVHTPLGTMCLLPHLLAPSSTELFTLVNTIGPDPLAFLRRRGRGLESPDSGHSLWVDDDAAGRRTRRRCPPLRLLGDERGDADDRIAQVLPEPDPRDFASTLECACSSCWHRALSSLPPLPARLHRDGPSASSKPRTEFLSRRLTIGRADKTTPGHPRSCLLTIAAPTILGSPYRRRGCVVPLV